MYTAGNKKYLKTIKARSKSNGTINGWEGVLVAQIVNIQLKTMVGLYKGIIFSSWPILCFTNLIIDV